MQCICSQMEGKCLIIHEKSHCHELNTCSLWLPMIISSGGIEHTLMFWAELFIQHHYSTQVEASIWVNFEDFYFYLSPCLPFHTGSPIAAFWSIDIRTPLLIPFLKNYATKELSKNIKKWFDKNSKNFKRVNPKFISGNMNIFDEI